MSEPSQATIAARLEAQREALIFQVAALLHERLSALEESRAVDHEAVLQPAHMVSTAQRFHELVQLGARIDWRLIANEYAWGRRVLGRMGVTWAHQEALIATYFEAAGRAQAWTPAERELLAEMAERMRAIARPAYEAAAPS